MKVEIKLVDKCQNGAYGNFICRGRQSYLITISKKFNSSLAEYWLTLLHELLHLFFTMVRRQGFIVSNRNEHKIIEQIEDTLEKSCRKYAKQKLIKEV